MDKDTRNILRNVVTNCRQLLEDTIAQVLEGQYGVYTTGRVDDVAKMDHLTPDELDVRERIVTHLEHIQSGGFKPADAADQLIREIAFTHLNRLAAYKMMEQRGLIREAVSRGLKSQGFMFYLADHPDDEHLWSTGQQELAYRHFLVWQGEQFANEISVLFSPYDPANVVFPPQRVLDQVLDLINSAELADIWTEDETIGWVYQYFTPKELRDKARKESQAPRNSYELAFRNQFYTPRYVVEFLTDNTLGRTWYEMLQGDTALIDHCQYLVRRPNEIFLAQGEDAPESDIDTSALSQEELLQQPVYIPYRALKDPRRLKVLDPACGSGHFLLYAFDLLAIIYEEAWERDVIDPNSVEPRLREKYATLDDLRCDIPRLILARNLHGIDIDRRATQIAALALWLRAQRYYNDHSLDRKDRPAITQGNIVLAEPMPGDRALLDEFVAELEPPIDQMVKRVFNEMKLAGEAGSLLKIEEAIQDDITRARKEWEQGLKHQKTPQQLALLPDWIEKKPEQLALFDVSKITDAEFFDRAEQMVLAALEAYAQRAENGHGLRRRLFADDAAGGFAFIELMRQRYDVILMNPPFGATTDTKEIKESFKNLYPFYAKNLACAFILRTSDLAVDTGFWGTVSDRSVFFRKNYRDVREHLLETFQIRYLDLGWEVLDDANVEVSALAAGRVSDSASCFIDARSSNTKETDLLDTIDDLRRGYPSDRTSLNENANLEVFPNAAFVYWVPKSVFELFKHGEPLGDTLYTAKQGLAAANSERFIRAWWEVPTISLSIGDWKRLAHGGPYSPYFRDFHFVIWWANDGYDLKQYVIARYPYLNGNAAWVVKNEDDYFKRGINYGKRGNCLSVQIMPQDMIFTDEGQAIFPTTNIDEDVFFITGLLNTRIYRYIINTYCGQHKHSGYINSLPGKSIGSLVKRELAELAKTHWQFICENREQEDESANYYVAFTKECYKYDRIQDLTAHWLGNLLRQEIELLSARIVAENKLAQELNISSNDRDRIFAAFSGNPFESALTSSTKPNQDITASDDDGESSELQFSVEQYGLLGIFCDANQTSAKDISEKADIIYPTLDLLKGRTSLLLSYVAGCIVGRWDIRYAIGERCVPELPDPFDPLPVCPPGMLQNADGLPATETPPSYPIDIDWDGILVDDPDHPDDIVRRMRGVLEVLWGDRAEAIEQEACEILGVKTLRDYFRKPGSGGFWDDHVKRYSKSRRKAPIYWLLQSSRKNYALWLYYHRLDKDLYYKALINYVQPKLRLEQSRLDALRAQLKEAGVAGREAKRLEREVEQQEALMSELQDFHDALKRVAQLNLVPDLNDGVVLNIAPLHELVPWKEAEKYWKALLKGEYEWSTISQQLRARGVI